MGRLNGKRALITGGSSGIGRAIALAFAAEGAAVAITYRENEAGAAETVRELERSGSACAMFRADFADPKVTGDIIARAESAIGVVDVLVNNAATLTRTSLLAMTPEDLDRVLCVSLRAPILVTQRFARRLVEARLPGAVINVGSVSGSRARSRVAHYEAAKAGLAMFTRSAALQLAEHGIRVNTIAPGLTATRANEAQWAGDLAVWEERAAGIPLKRAGLPSDHAGAAVFLASDEASWMTGAEIVIDGGMSVV